MRQYRTGYGKPPLKLIKLKILLTLCLLFIVLISILPSTSAPFVPKKVMAQKVPDNTGGTGGGTGNVKPNDNSGVATGGRQQSSYRDQERW